MFINRHIVQLLFSLFMVMYFISSCNVMKQVPTGDKLFTGSNITPATGKLDKSIKSDLIKLTRPVPNSSILGIKYKLMIFNFFPEPKKQKGIFYNLKYKLGEPPVLLSTAKPTSTEVRIADYLFNHGYFNPVVTSETIIKNGTASINYLVNKGARYVVRNKIYPSDTSALTTLLNKSADKSLVEKGQFVDLNTLKAERESISVFLKENGYFYFEPDFILFKIDTLQEGQADLFVQLKENLPEKVLKPWGLSNITIFSNYKIEKDSILMKDTGRRERRFTIVDKKESYKPTVFEHTVALREGQLYNRVLHSLTIERLMNLNTFRFVKIAFFPLPDSNALLLNTRIYMSPAKKQTARLELSANSKSTSFLGSELSLNYRNLNLFKGAEILEAKITGGFDVQVGGAKSSGNSYSLNTEVNLLVPKLLPPFIKIKTKRSPYIPRTVFTPALEYLKRPDLYTMRSVRFSAGYHLKRGKTIEHFLRLININSIDPSEITPKFDSILAQDVTLKASFEKQLVIGSRYQFHYNNTYRTDHAFNYSMDGIISTSGNLAGIFVSANSDSVGAKKIFNIPLSQFLKLQADVRGYWKIKPKLSFANRIIAGVAFAYKNSSSVPYSEQFIIGGSSSVRAFRIRTLGPGSYRTVKSAYQANESGEIKLELNSELRYNMGKFIRLATFMDAGNIWLRKEAPDKPGSGLEKGDLFREMAIGGGAGIRFDASLFIIRFDLAIPFRKPWYPEGKRWVFNEIDFGSDTWRKENLMFNIGIGYPF